MGEGAKLAGKKFFDNYTDLGGGGRFLSQADKQVLIENGVPFKITAVQFDEHNEHGPRFIAFALVPDVETGEDEERKIGFPVGSGVQSRDSMLEAMKDYFTEEDSEPVTVKMEKPGRAIFLVNAEA